MAQSMRPISTVTNQGSFTGPSAHGSVDGTAPDTGDYWSGNDNDTDVLEVLLTDLSSSTPGSGTCTVSIYEAESDSNSAPASGGTNPTYTLEVYEGGTQRAVRSSITSTESSFTLDNNLTFSSSAITDWSDVRVRFTSFGTGGKPADRRAAAISYIDISVPDAAGSDELLADDVESASNVSTPSIGQTHALTVTSVESSSEVSSPDVGQVHSILADDVESAAEVATPSLGQVHALTSVSVESASEISIPSLSESHSLTSTSVESASELSTPGIGQTHALTVSSVESASEIGVPALSQKHGLTTVSVESTSELSSPSITENSSTDDLLANSLEAVSEVSTPVLSQVHAITASNVTAQSDLSVPALDGAKKKRKYRGHVVAKPPTRKAPVRVTVLLFDNEKLEL